VQLIAAGEEEVGSSTADPSGNTRGALWPEQAISLIQALRIFALDGAVAQRRGAQCGSLVIGKSADLIVLNRNLFDIASSDIADTIVEITMFNGREVFRN
jgi:predicted amidohydrolase YtcJ